MSESLPDVWSTYATELHYETQDVQELARSFQKQQNPDDPDQDSNQQDGDTPKQS